MLITNIFWLIFVNMNILIKWSKKYFIFEEGYIFNITLKRKMLITNIFWLIFVNMNIFTK